MPVPTSAFRSSNRSSMGSNVYTNQNQGGGDSKAGFPYQVGRDSWASIAFGTCNPTAASGCATLKCLQFTSNARRASDSRPIGSTSATNRYFHIPGAR